jgi:hypothetical protein
MEEIYEQIYVNTYWISVRPNDRDDLLIHLLLNIAMQPQEAKCHSERMRRRLYNTSVSTKLEPHLGPSE